MARQGRSGQGVSEPSASPDVQATDCLSKMGNGGSAVASASTNGLFLVSIDMSR